MKFSKQLFYLRLLRSRSRIFKIVRQVFHRERSLDMGTMIPFYRRIWQDAAKKTGAEFVELADGIWRFSYKDRRTVVNNFRVQIDDPVVLDIAGNKALSYQLMGEERLAVPEYQVFDLKTLQLAIRFMEKHVGNLFVVKPAIGTSGARGITTYINSFQDCLHASVLASLYCDIIIIECWVPGESYRILILDDKMIHATRRRGIRFQGNGKSTVRQLIQQENEYRKKNDKKPLPLLTENDHDYLSTLNAQGLSSDSVLRNGQEVLVRSCDSSQPGYKEVRTVFNEEVTGLICRKLQDEAVRAARALASKFAGVDIICLDPSRSLAETGGIINEINTTPGLHHHYNLLNKQSFFPAEIVLKYLLRISNAG